MKTPKLIKLLLLLVFIFSLPLMSAIRGRIRILVTNSKWEPLSGVKITLISTKTAIVKHTIFTNTRGVAIHGSLENHVFEFTFEKEGYQLQKKMIKIPAGLLKKEDIMLLTIEEAIEKMEERDPYAQAINRYNQAVFFLKKEEYEKALSLLKESISLDDTLYQSHYEIGKIYYHQEKYQEAIGCLEEVILLNKEYAPAYRLMAAVYEKMGKKDESEKHTKLAQEIGGVSGIDKYNEAVKHFNDGDIDSAILLFEEAIKLDSELADAYYQLGMAYVNKVKNEKAISNLEKYLKLEPEGKNANTAQSILKFLKEQK
jgi:tetratricopeptide (TPR) repeat protein